MIFSRISKQNDGTLFIIASGFSDEEKITDNIASGSTFLEEDTHKEYVFNGTEWILRNGGSSISTDPDWEVVEVTIDDDYKTKWVIEGIVKEPKVMIYFDSKEDLPADRAVFGACDTELSKHSELYNLANVKMVYSLGNSRFIYSADTSSLTIATSGDSYFQPTKYYVYLLY